MAATKKKTPVNRIAENGAPKKKEVKKKKSLVIQAPQIEVAKLKIVGMSDLICKQMSQKTVDALVGRAAKASPQAKAAIEPEQEVRDSLYLMPGSKPAMSKGATYGFPASGLKKAVATAGSRFLREGSTLSAAHIAGSLFVVPTQTGSDLVLLKHPAKDPYARADQGRNPKSKGAVVIHRGAFSEWSMEFLVRYNASVLSIEQVVTLFQWGGFSVGIGEWRPEKGGTYGQFDVSI